MKKALSVKTVVSYIDQILITDPILRSIAIEGEISNYKITGNHLFFNLKEGDVLLRCVAFNYARLGLPELVEGDQVTCHGTISTYSRGSNYQLIVKSADKKGQGDAFLAYMRLKAKLEKEGLFDGKYKVGFPHYPKKIGLVTSPTGAAVRDMINVIQRRWPLCEVILYPAIVQGNRAPSSVIEGLSHFEHNHRVDLVIVGRGGGSFEDLNAFNDENLVRYIFAMETPVISAVGHETDFTLTDFVSDLRCATPTEAAEITTPNREDEIHRIMQSARRLIEQIGIYIDNSKDYFEYLSKVMRFQSPSQTIERDRLKMKQWFSSLIASSTSMMTKEYYDLEQLKQSLEAHNPLGILEKGYALLQTEERKPITSIAALSNQSQICVRMKDGEGVFRIEKETR